MVTDPGQAFSEIDLWSNRRLIHPLSRRLAAALSHTPVTPNMVSCLGAGAAAAAAACYAGLAYPWSVAAGFLAHVTWHVLDGADGDLARRTGRSSAVGEIVDGLCDYIGQAIVYAALALVLARTIGAWAWPVALASAVARAVQSNSYESRRREYQYWGHGRPWIRHTLFADRLPRHGALAALGRLYLVVSSRVARSHPALEGRLGAGVNGGGESALRTRALYRSYQRAAIAAAAPLSANARTIALGLSMALGSPAYFFAYEIVGLSLALCWSFHVQRRADAALLERLSDG